MVFVRLRAEVTELYSESMVGSWLSVVLTESTTQTHGERKCPLLTCIRNSMSSQEHGPYKTEPAQIHLCLETLKESKSGFALLTN